MTFNQNGQKAWTPALSTGNGKGVAGNGDSYMQNIREHRDRYSLTSSPWNQKLSFILHIASDSPDIGKVLDEQEAAETSNEMDVTFTMKGLKRLIWQSKTSIHKICR